MPRRLFWVVFVLSLWCFSRLSSAQGLPSRFQGGIMGEAVLSNGTTIPIQFSGDPSFPVPFNVPLWRDPFTESTYFNLPSTGAVMYSSDAAFGTDISAVTPLGVTVLETDQNNETLLSIQGEGSGISSSVNGEAVGAEEPTDENMQTWISEAEADNPDTAVAFTTSPLLACATTASSSSTTTAASSDAPLICSGTDNLVLFAVDPSVMAATDSLTSVQVGQEEIKVVVFPKKIPPSDLFSLTTGSGGAFINESLPEQFADVVVLVNGLPTGQSLTLTLNAEGIKDSGGHLYDTNRPAGVFLNLKTSAVLGRPITETIIGEKNPPACQGKVEIGNCFGVGYKPSDLGGKEKILVTAPGALTLNKPVIHVTVSGTMPKEFGALSAPFVNIENLPFPLDLLMDPFYQYFTLVGNGPTSVANYPYPICSVPNGHLHENHYAPFPILLQLAEAAQEFYEKTGIKLEINDISLPDGGVFDICNNWKPPYIYYRAGTSVLISNDLSRLEVLKLDRIMGDHNFVRPFPELLEYDLVPWHIELISSP